MACSRSCLLKSFTGFICLFMALIGAFIFTGGYGYQNSQHLPCWVTSNRNCTIDSDHGTSNGTLQVQLKDHHQYDLNVSNAYCGSSCCQDELKDHDQMVCLFSHSHLLVMFPPRLQSYFSWMLYLGGGLMAVAVLTCCLFSTHSFYQCYRRRGYRQVEADSFRQNSNVWV